MDFIVSRNDLLEPLGLAKAVTEQKSTIPILANVLLRVEGERLTIVGTDLDISIQASCEVQAEEQGAATVPAKRLFDIVRLQPEDAEIRIKLLKNDFIQLKSGKSEYKLPGLSVESFPQIPSFPCDGVVALPGAALKEMIRCTIFAVSREESAYATSGALLALSPTQMRMVATDGHRLAIVTKNADLTQVESETSIMIPYKALVELQGLIGGSDPVVGFAISENKQFFAVEGKRLTSRMLAARFPNYELVLPKANDKLIAVPVADLAKAVKRVGIMTDDRIRCIKLAMDAAMLMVTANSVGIGEACEVLPLEYEGSPLEIGFNPKYILDFLGACGSTNVTVALKDGETQAELRPVGESEFEYRYVLMPMKQ
ncbi:MAG: DNA polymerase III subunit beta [Acidobacteriia bacterium]|nr:DNA polymerase III subunit beta [Terriglobia bacterium]